MATPRVAAGALFFDQESRVLLVKPSYKKGWDIPGGYVEPGESPRTACDREIAEELGISWSVGALLVVDWAPIVTEGDKLLFIFDAGVIDKQQLAAIRLADGEIVDFQFNTTDQLERFMPERLARRIRTAIEARSTGTTAYAENGISHIGIAHRPE